MIGRTHKSWLRLVTALALALAFAGYARAEEDATAQIEKMFREGVDLYQQGKYSESQQKLREVLRLDPRKELAARLVDEAGTRVMARMMADHRMGNEPAYIWQLYKKHYVAKLADKERMTKMAARVVDPATAEDERALLFREFAELGHYAVPVLAPYLKDKNHEDYRTYARIAIARMGSRAVLPVVELIGHSDELMRENAVLVISDIQPLDPRAIPALKARIQDEKESAVVKHLAQRTVQRITGLAPEALKTAADYYYDAANRYYLDRTGVAEEAEEVDGMVWHLTAEGELSTIQYPLWAWNDQMAEDSALRGIANNPDKSEFYPLWACIQGAQYTEVKDLLDIVNEQPNRHTFSAEEKKDIEVWDAKLVNTRRLAAAVGKEYCNGGLAKVHADLKRLPGHSRLPQVGIFLARELAFLDPMGELLTPPPVVVIPLKPGAPPITVSSANAPVTVQTENAPIQITVRPASLEILATAPPQKNGKNGKDAAVVPDAAPITPPPAISTSALVNGLDSPDEGIQYQCALTLAAIDRFPSKWIGSEKVAKVLGRGISEAKAIQILLVEEDHNKANELRERMEKLGYGTSIAISARDAIVQARSFPPKDIAIVAENLRRDLTAEQLVEELRADVRTRYLPVGVLHIQSERNLIQSRFGTTAPLVEREMAGDDLKTAVEAVAAKRAQESVTKREAHRISRVCAEALAKVDCRDTYILFDDAVENAIEALTNRPDDVRVPCAVFLGHAEGGTKKDKAADTLKRVFEDGANAVLLRREALRALGRVKLEGQEAVYVKSQADADQEVKDIGAEAFGQISRANKSISDLIRQERIDKDKKEK